MSKIPSFFFPCLALLWTLAPFHVVPAETRNTQVLFKNSTLLTVMKHYHAFESFQDLKFRFGIFLHLLPKESTDFQAYLKTRWFFLKMILIEKCFTKGQTKSKWFFKPTFLPKNEQTNSTLLLWYLRSTCFCSFFGRNWRQQKDISKLTDL